MDFNCYADDTQLCVPVEDDRTRMIYFEACLSAVNHWMSHHFQLLNTDNISMLGTDPARQQFNPVTLTRDDQTVTVEAFISEPKKFFLITQPKLMY